MLSYQIHSINSIRKKGGKIGEEETRSACNYPSRSKALSSRGKIRTGDVI